MTDSTPIYSALKKYSGDDILRLHMPGHIGRGITAEELRTAAGIDVTEVPGLDDLHLPRGIIARSQVLMARAFGAGESHFLVNGTTSGIHALFMALFSEGQKVLVPRNAHRSFFGGMVMSGAMPVYLPARTEHRLGLALSVTAEDVSRALLAHPDIGAVFIGSPSYYGTTCDIKKISAVTHSVGKMLLVDEAHGAHFNFSSLYPQPALQEGADAVVNGLHKTLPVLNQGACLHLAPGVEEKWRFHRACSLLTTTSPSYLIMASMELARAFMEENGESMLAQAYDYASELRGKIRTIPGLKCYYQELKQVPGVKDVDPLKVLIEVGATGYNGQQFARRLRQKYKIQVELAEGNCILAMFSIFHKHKEWERFYQALADIASAGDMHQSRPLQAMEPPPAPTVLMSPRRAFFSPVKKLPFLSCAGKIAGEMVAPYPPGIPCLLPGELITSEVLEYLEFVKGTGIKLHGPQDQSLKEMTILDV